MIIKMIMELRIKDGRKAPGISCLAAKKFTRRVKVTAVGNCQILKVSPAIKPRDKRMKAKTTVFTRPDPVKNHMFDLPRTLTFILIGCIRLKIRNPAYFFNSIH